MPPEVAPKPHAPAAPVETDAQRVDREIRAANTARVKGNAKPITGNVSPDTASKLDAKIASYEKELARYQSAAAADGNPRRVAIADINRHLRHFRKLRAALK